MLIEKSTNKDEMVANIKKIIENTKDIKQLIKLRDYIIFIQKYVLQGEEEEILEMISRKVRNDQMSTLIERLRRENDAIRKEAREQARRELREEAREQARREIREEAREEMIRLLKEQLKNEMLKNGETEEKIEMYTNVLISKLNMKN